MNARQLRSIPCALALTASMASAQCELPEIVDGPPPDGLQIRVAIPEILAVEGVIGASAVGEFTGDSRLDAAVVIGDRAFVLVAPNNLQLFVPLDSGCAVRDLVVIPGAGSYGLDLIICATEEGLVSWKINGATNALEPTPLESVDWRDVKAVRAGDVDGDGLTDLIGLDADGLRVIGWLDIVSGDGAGFELLTTNPIRDIALARWTAEPAADSIVLMRTRSLELVDREGTLVEDFETAGDSVAMEVMPGASLDAIAWVTKVPNSTLEWLHVKRSGGNSDVGIPLGTWAASDIGSGDIEGDGDADLVLTSRYFPLFLGLLSTAANEPSTIGTNVFSTASTNYFFVAAAPYDADMSQQAARISLGDFDRDGDLDGFTGVEATRDFAIQRSGLVLESEHTITVIDRHYYDSQHMALHIGWPIERPLEATHFEAAIWQSECWNDPLSGDDNSRFDVELATCTQDDDSFKFEVSLPSNQAMRPNYYYVMIARLVVRDENGVDVHAYPDATLLVEWIDGIGIISGTSPVPNIGPMPPGPLPPQGQGSQIPPP